MRNTDVNDDALRKIPKNNDATFDEMGFYWISILINQYAGKVLDHHLRLQFDGFSCPVAFDSCLKN